MSGVDCCASIFGMFCSCAINSGVSAGALGSVPGAASDIGALGVAAAGAFVATCIGCDAPDGVDGAAPPIAKRLPMPEFV